MPFRDLAADAESTSAKRMRVEPVQDRSIARVDILLDATAALVDEIGFDRITTGMVAEKAGVSIGTVYRYFPDRLTALRALRDRAEHRFHSYAAECLEERQPAGWSEAIDVFLDSYAEMYIHEPGFRIMRFIDHERYSRDEAEQALVADAFVEAALESLRDDFHMHDDDGLLALRVEAGVEVAESLIGRAFGVGGAPDSRYLDELREMLHLWIDKHYA